MRVLLLFLLAVHLSACFKEDVTSPVITLHGGNEITHPFSTTYKDAGYEAFDNRDKDITYLVETKGTPDVDSAGTYFIKYNVTDASGNKAVETLRIVHVTLTDTSLAGIYETTELCSTDSAEYFITISRYNGAPGYIKFKNLNRLPDGFMLYGKITGITGQAIEIPAQAVADTTYSGSGAVNNVATEITLKFTKSFNDTTINCTAVLKR